MNPVLWLILVWVIAFPLLAIAGAWFLFRPNPLRQALRDYQSLAGSVVTLFAAGLALLGVMYTMTVQKESVDRQIESQRATEDRARVTRRRQFASAFVGEINVI